MNNANPNGNPQFAPKKATVPAWFMILLMVILVAVVGLLVARIMNNQKNKGVEDVTTVETDPYAELEAKVRALKGEYKEVMGLSYEEGKYDEFKSAHKALYNRVKDFQKATMKSLEEQEIVVGVEDELGIDYQYKEGYGQYGKLMADVGQIISDLGRNSPLERDH